ncbi:MULTISPECIES: hypothetical protein [Bacillus]|uniref:hypothetical protein n=1 Tax=Bacillus TaxID=1386 RepID=UPI0004FFEE9F|nr:hypothetical protein [Bacillus pseudomycoides]KFN15406.1 hypothetical protein DJ94_3316 [Bacillus pseudomycoides]
MCERNNITFVPVNWFEFDVFKGSFDKFPSDERLRSEEELSHWLQKQLSLFNKGAIPFNSVEYDKITQEKYEWLQSVNPELQNIVSNARHYIMVARVKNVIEENEGKRILCIHGADHNYWYYAALKDEKNIEVIYPLRS